MSKSLPPEIMSPGALFHEEWMKQRAQQRALDIPLLCSLIMPIAQERVKGIEITFDGPDKNLLTPDEPLKWVEWFAVSIVQTIGDQYNQRGMFDISTVHETNPARYPANWHKKLMQMALDVGLDPDFTWTDINVCFKGGLKTLISEVARRSHNSAAGMDLLRLLLARGAKHTNKRVRYNPLTYAAYYESDVMMDLLFEYGAHAHDPDCSCSFGAMGIAITENRDIRVFERLLRQGGDINRIYANGCTHLDAAIATRAMRYGLKTGVKDDKVEFLLKNGADPNLGTRVPQWTKAISRGVTHLLPLFYQFGAKIDAPMPNDFFCSALHIWVWGFVEEDVCKNADEAEFALDFLIRHGAPTDVVREDGFTALDFAIAENKPVMTHLLKSRLAHMQAEELLSKVHDTVKPPVPQRL